VQPANVAPEQYLGMSCQQLKNEKRRIGTRQAELSPTLIPVEDEASVKRIFRSSTARSRRSIRSQPTRGAGKSHLILAGEPINNRRLAELMGCTPTHASRCVAQLEGPIRKARRGREVSISLNQN
jgi:hypothetical protein